MHVSGGEGNRDLPPGRQVINGIPALGRFHWKAFVRVVGDQLLQGDRIEDSSTERVRSDRISFFDQPHLDFQVLLLCQLQQMDGTCQVGRASTDKKHIKRIFFTGLIHHSPSSEIK